MIKALKTNQLYNKINLQSLDFKSTEELKGSELIIGQQRAYDAINLALGINYEGYNLFVMGDSGTGRHSLVNKLILEKNKIPKEIHDWCYVNNFDNFNKPIAITLPKGMGVEFKTDMQTLIEILQESIPLIFSSPQYLSKKQSLEYTLKDLQNKAFTKIKDEAKTDDIFVNFTNKGVTLSPLKNGKVLNSEEYVALKLEDRDILDKKILEYTEILEDNSKIEKELTQEYSDKFTIIEDKFIQTCVNASLKSFREKYNQFKDVTTYLDNVQEDITDHFQDFLPVDQSQVNNSVENTLAQNFNIIPSLDMYNVNVLVCNKKTKGAPVIYEDNPTYSGLFGQIEHVSRMGTITTDFNLIKAGSLHEANGGYLIINARALLSQPYAWDGLKRMLISKEIHLETVEESMGLTSSVSLKPHSMKLDVKIILVGSRNLYYDLYNYDPDFKKLFKIEADFEDEIHRNEQNVDKYANKIASIIKNNQLLPLNKKAVAKVIECSSRLIDNADKLSTNLSAIMDLLQEANFIAKSKNSDLVTHVDINEVLNNRIHRSQRIKQEIYEQINNGTIQIQTQGEAIGQINALSILDLGNHSFGTPVKISALTRMGRQGIVDIEREVNLSGSIHSKGVMILSSYIATKYSQNVSLSLNASLVFEQSYSIIDGDSASLAELYALLSSISNTPIKQNFAITGSINQNGDVQAIGGVNEKIEGFFDVCKLKDSSFKAAVIIPQSNVNNLMLKEEVLEASRNGQFKIYAIKHAEEGINLLLGLNAGIRGAHGKFPKNSLNYLVEKKLEAYQQEKA